MLEPEDKKGVGKPQNGDPAPQGFTGTVNMQLTDLIQMLCLSRADIIIRIKSGTGGGFIFIKGGQISHAETDNAQGEAAFFEIFRWRDGHFEVLPFHEPDLCSIRKPWEHLLLESMRMRDEESVPRYPSLDPFDGNGEAASTSDLGGIEDRIDSMFDTFAHSAREFVLTESEETSSYSAETRKVRVLIVDDSPFFARQLKRMLLSDPEIEVAGVARNGKECLDFLDGNSSVDLITLDIQMPVMQGDTALKHIMIRYPIPVLVLSSLNPESLDDLFDYFQLGAVDFLAKPDRGDNTETYGQRLCELAKSAATAKMSNFRRWRKAKSLPEQNTGNSGAEISGDKVLAILGAEGAFMDWFRLPLAQLCRKGLVIGLQQIPEIYLGGFARLIEDRSAVRVVPLQGASEILRNDHRFYLGNACRPVRFKLSPEGGALSAEFAAPGNEKWQSGLQQWLRQLAEQAGPRLSVYLLSAAHSLPGEFVEELLQRQARLILPQHNTVVCTELVECAQACLPPHSQQVIRGRNPEALLEVW